MSDSDEASAVRPAKVKKTSSIASGADQPGENKIGKWMTMLKKANKKDTSDSDEDPVQPATNYTLGQPHKLGKRDVYVRVYCKEDRTLFTLTPLVLKNGLLQKEKFAKSVSLEPNEFNKLVSMGEQLCEEAVNLAKEERRRCKSIELAEKQRKDAFRNRKRQFDIDR